MRIATKADGQQSPMKSSVMTDKTPLLGFAGHDDAVDEDFERLADQYGL